MVPLFGCIVPRSSQVSRRIGSARGSHPSEFLLVVPHIVLDLHSLLAPFKALALLALFKALVTLCSLKPLFKALHLALTPSARFKAWLLAPPAALTLLNLSTAPIPPARPVALLSSVSSKAL